MKNLRAQIWVETVIYTLIGLAIIGILLAVSKPKIDSMKDKLAIEQTIDSMNLLNSKIIEAEGFSQGNKRKVELKISKGQLVINPNLDSIYWVLDSNYKYSESGSIVDIGNLKLITTGNNPWKIMIFTNYSGIDLKYQNKAEIKTFDVSPSVYNIFVENKGASEGNIVIDLFG